MDRWPPAIAQYTPDATGMSAAGAHRLQWDGRNDAGRPVAAGVYFARLTVRGPGVDEMQTRKLTLRR